jgi:hypothetical protein
MPTIVLQFPSPASPELMHRVLNFVEDVWRFANDQKLGSVSDIDHYATGRFTVTVSTKRKLGDMQRAIQQLLSKHMLEHEAVVSHLPTEGA